MSSNSRLKLTYPLNNVFKAYIIVVSETEVVGDAVKTVHCPYFGDGVSIFCRDSGGRKDTDRKEDH